jgi:outer membrane protein
MKGIHLLLLLVTACCGKARAQSPADSLSLTLPEVVDMAKSRSIASKQAYTVRETKYWEWRTYLSNYKPQLSLSGVLPGYSKTFNQVVQPNGAIQFQPVHNDNSSLSLSFSQSIAQTGGTIYGTTQLQRFTDFDRKNVLYNGVPFGIGLSQPLFQYNSLKWNKKIQPLLFNESKQAYIEGMENIALTASGYFFDLLLAQVNLQIAETNLGNTKNILSIANQKLELGRISKNEILQLQLEELTSLKAVGIARRDMEIAALNLRTYTGLDQTAKIALVIPGATIHMNISTDSVIKQAYANRSDAISFIRRIAEAQRDIAEAKSASRLNATLTAQLGYSNSASTIPAVYQSLKNQQLIQMGLSIPVLDWGRSKAKVKTAEANMQLTSYEVEQDKQLFIQQIVTQVTLFDMMRGQVTLTEKADSIASEKYQIAGERYVLGNLSVTDLSIAFRDKDQARRDHIAALRDLWGAYYQLRYLSLYDFEKSQPILY